MHQDSRLRSMGGLVEYPHEFHFHEDEDSAAASNSADHEVRGAAQPLRDDDQRRHRDTDDTDGCRVVARETRTAHLSAQSWNTTIQLPREGVPSVWVVRACL